MFRFKTAISFNPEHVTALVRCAVYPACTQRQTVNSLSDMPILCSSNSAANDDMMSKIYTNGIQLSV